MSDLVDGEVKKVTWASFGDHPRSFFFAYVMNNGSPGHRVGKAIPSTLRPFLEHASQASFEKASALCVQLGADRSWAAWMGTSWACRNVPAALQETLCQLSSDHHKDENGLEGVSNVGSITNVTWHANGSYYVKSSGHDWSFCSAALQQGWNDMWNGIKNVAANEPTELAVSITPTLH